MKTIQYKVPTNKLSALPAPELWGLSDEPLAYENKHFKKDLSKPSLQTSTVVGDYQDDILSGLIGGSPMG